MATAPSPNDLTRQQLDELDALLQKMLSVPMPAETPMPTASLPAAPLPTVPRVAPPVDPPLPPHWRVDPPPVPSDAGAFVPHLALVEPPSSVSLKPAPAPEPAPAPTAPPAPAPKIAPAPKPAATAPVIAPAPKPVAKAPAKPQAAPAPAAPVATPQVASAPITPAPTPKASPKITPAPAAPPVPFLLLPFVALNALFDAVCGLFGPPGRVLRSGFFKHLYGLTGLALLLYTAVHVAQVEKWITLPVTLPWPR